MGEKTGDIIFEGQLADAVWNRIKDYPNLLAPSEELETNLDGDYSSETKAKLTTLFQIAAFGDDGKHDALGGKLSRNLRLTKINSEIIQLAIESVSQSLVLVSEIFGTKSFDLGFASGATITYPLSSLGAKLYHKNQLAPHLFEEPHLERDCGNAAAVFIGAMIHLPSIPLLLESHGQFTKFEEPPLLCRLIASQTVKLLPTVKKVTWGKFGPTLLSENSEKLPTVVTAFSGKGNGELLAIRVGFKKEGRIDSISGDRRYILDLNELNRSETTLKRRYELLKAWAWFLELAGSTEESECIVAAASELKK